MEAAMAKLTRNQTRVAVRGLLQHDDVAGDTFEGLIATRIAHDMV